MSRQSIRPANCTLEVSSPGDALGRVCGSRRRTLVLNGIWQRVAKCQLRNALRIISGAHLAIRRRHLWQDGQEWPDEIERPEP